ncbi:MAG: hypothetical protein M3O94_01180, partial [Actinomycetota bacterium]|nr:hypothetical protein [Actinomycetota bacterium]
FALTDLSCDDANSTTDLATLTAHVVLDPGETVTCTFTDTDQRGHIIVKKLVSPQGAGDRVFQFYTPCGAPGLAEGESFDCGPIAPGTYDVSEADPSPDFALTDLSCDDANSTTDLATLTAHVVLDPGETVTCTFTDTQQVGG